MNRQVRGKCTILWLCNLLCGGDFCLRLGWWGCPIRKQATVIKKLCAKAHSFLFYMSGNFFFSFRIANRKQMACVAVVKNQLTG